MDDWLSFSITFTLDGFSILIFVAEMYDGILLRNLTLVDLSERNSTKLIITKGRFKEQNWISSKCIVDCEQFPWKLDEFSICSQRNISALNSLNISWSLWSHNTARFYLIPSLFLLRIYFLKVRFLSYSFPVGRSRCNFRFLASRDVARCLNWV